MDEQPKVATYDSTHSHVMARSSYSAATQSTINKLIASDGWTLLIFLLLETWWRWGEALVLSCLGDGQRAGQGKLRSGERGKELLGLACCGLGMKYVRDGVSLPNAVWEADDDTVKRPNGC